MTPPKSKMTVVKLMGVACPFLSRPVAGLARPRGIADTHRDARRPCNRGLPHIRLLHRGRRRAFLLSPPLSALPVEGYGGPRPPFETAFPRRTDFCEIQHPHP